MGSSSHSSIVAIIIVVAPRPLIVICSVSPNSVQILHLLFPLLLGQQFLAETKTQ